MPLSVPALDLHFFDVCVLQLPCSAGAGLALQHANLTWSCMHARIFMEAPKYVCSRHGCNAKSIVAVAEGCAGLCTAQSYAHDQGMEIRNITLLSMQVSAPNNTAIDSTAAAAASGGGGGGGGSVDLATIGKGIGGPPLMSRSPTDRVSKNPFWAWASNGPVVDLTPTVPDRVINLVCPERREHHLVSHAKTCPVGILTFSARLLPRTIAAHLVMAPGSRHPAVCQLWQMLIGRLSCCTPQALPRQG